MKTRTILVICALSAVALLLAAERVVGAGPKGENPPATRPAGDLATQRAALLKAKLGEFRLVVRIADQGEILGAVLLSAGEIPWKSRGRVQTPPSNQVSIGNETAAKIIDHLLSEGLLGRAKNVRQMGDMTRDLQYVLSVNEHLEDGLGEYAALNLRTLKRLDDLERVLGGDASKAMGELLALLRSHRTAWERAAADPNYVLAQAAEWVTSETSLDQIAGFVRTVLRASADSEAEVTSRHSVEMSTTAGDVHGGGKVWFARCRQKFLVTEVLVGAAETGARTLEYGFVEKSDAHPGPRAERPIPRRAAVILLLDAKGSLCKVLPDTPDSRKVVAAKFPVLKPKSGDIGLPSPQELRDAGDLLAALTPRIAEGWELSEVDYGRTFPPERPAGEGFHVVIFDTQAPVRQGKRAPWTDVHIWMMEGQFGAKGPFLLHERPVDEIGRWRGRRVFLYGGEERWPKRRDDVLAALKAADKEKPRGQPDAIRQRFDGFAAFVEKLGPKVHPKWHCQVFRYGSQQLGNPGGREGRGLHVLLRQRIKADERIGAEDPYGEAWLWLMDASFRGELPKKTEKNFVPDELGRWRGGRVFLWAFARGEGNWLTVRDDLRAVMQASSVQVSGEAGISSQEPADALPEPIPPDLPNEVREQIEQLRSDRVGARVRAAQALGKMKAAAAAPFLIELLADEAIYMAPVPDPSHGETISGMEWQVSQEAGKALLAIGPPAIEPLAKALQHRTPLVRVRAAGLLAQLSDARGRDVLLAVAKDVSFDKAARWDAMGTLAKQKDPGVVEPLTAELKNPDHIWRAAMLLGEAGNSRATEPLVWALADSRDSSARAMVLQALGKIGKPPQKLDLILSALKDERKDVRLAAAHALGKIADRRAVEPLIATLKDKDGYVRLMAASALGYIGDSRAIEPLIKTLKDDPDEDTRSYAAKALGKIKNASANEAVLTALETSLKDEHSRVLSKGWLAIVRLATPAARPPEATQGETVDANTPHAQDETTIAAKAKRTRLSVRTTDLHVVPEYLTVWETAASPDASRLAYKARRGDKGFVAVVDGKVGPEYSDILVPPRFSPDGKRVFYVAENGDGQLVVLDGVAGEPFESIHNPVFSTNGRHLAYVGLRGKKQVLVVDDRAGAEHEYDGMDVIRPVLSLNGDRLAYCRHKGDKWVAVTDGNDSRPYDAILPSGPAFSPDSRHVAYAAYLRGKGMCLVLDGVEQEWFEGIAPDYPPVFSPDGEHLAYVALHGKNMVVVRDGKKEKEYRWVGLPVFSADSKQLCYVGLAGGFIADHRAVIVDGQQKGTNRDEVRSPLFSPDGKRLAWIAMRSVIGLAPFGGVDTGSKESVVVDGKKGKEYGKIQALTFCPQGRRVAYVAFWDGRFVVVDGQEQEKFAAVGNGPLFSPDGKHVAYSAGDGQGHGFLVVDDSKHPIECLRVAFTSPTTLRVLGCTDKQRRFVILDVQLIAPGARNEGADQ